MNQNEKLTFAEFHQKLLKYCSNGARYSAQENDILSRFEKLIVQRDACLAQLIIRREAEMVCSEDISDTEHQLAELVERLESIEKKCKLLTLEQQLNDAEERPDKQLPQQEVLEPTVDSASNELNEQTLNRFLRKFCNIYAQFNSCVDIIRAFSLADNQFFEFNLKDKNVSELREQIWSSFASSSVHLDSWENML
ncbi:uncharacterized protein LOC125764828 isoform X1 [Anopheles funestus]|uniref:uncharacterized protein LOC125764828 isoform X1 n=2 Tax=Anopheles funestus TaxID=62324 RepID=UPI0020C6986C|nr:uncharacterized protein LOC125764828 isoform X1 [Anopheles funestus]